MGCGETFMKLVLVIVNIIFFLASGLMLAFGITGKANPELLAEIFNKILPAADRDHLNDIGINLTQIIVDNSTFMIIVGVVGLVISLFGFIGACCMVQWMLVAYAIVLIILLLAEVALIIFAAVYSESFKDTFTKAMRKTLTDEFKTEITINDTGAVIFPTRGVEVAWATIQIKYKCCGASGSNDYATLTEWNRKVSNTYPNAAVPVSCCKINKDVNNNEPTGVKFTDFTNLNDCLTKGSNSSAVNTQNCYDALKEETSKFIRDYKGIAIGIAAGICGLELILIVFTFCLCARAKDSDKFV